MSNQNFNSNSPNSGDQKWASIGEPSACAEKIKETNAVEMMDEDDFDDDTLELDAFDEEGFEQSFFGGDLNKKTQKTISAVDIVVDGDFDIDFDGDFGDDQLLDLQSFDNQVKTTTQPQVDTMVESCDEELNEFENEVDIAPTTEESDDSYVDEVDNDIEEEVDSACEDDNAIVVEDDEFVEPTLDTVDDCFDTNDNGAQQDDDEEFLTDAQLAIDKNNWKNILSAEAKFKPHFSFDMKLRLASDSIKGYYNTIKNLLLSYGLHARLSAKKENFSKGRMPIARMAINGKTLKVYLAVDPASLDKKYFRHQDVGFRKTTALLPTLINAKTDLAQKRICELIVTLVAEKELAIKKRFKPVDYAEGLTLSGYTKLSRSGYDYMLVDNFTRKQAHQLPEFFAEKFINERKLESRDVDLVVHTAYLDDLARNFEPCSVVKLQDLIDKGLAGKNCNYLRIKASETLDRPLYIYCDDITPTAAKMVCLTRGQVFRYSTSKVDFLHLQLEDADGNNITQK